MKIKWFFRWSAALCVSALVAQGQETNQLEKFDKQLKEMQERFDQQQRQMRENFERVQREQRQQIDNLMKEVDALKKEKAGETEKKKLEAELATELQKNQPTNAPASTVTPQQPFSPSQPLTIARAGSAYMNISFDTLMDVGWSTASDPSAFLQLGDHDPIKRGFS